MTAPIFKNSKDFGVLLLPREFHAHLELERQNKDLDPASGKGSPNQHFGALI
jgi:hypothetical protein